jgi:hypothetical protein
VPSGSFELHLARHRRGLRRRFVALALRQLAARSRNCAVRLLQLRFGLAALGLEHIGIHHGHYLSGRNEFAFVDPDLLQTTGYPRGDVDLDRLDAAIAAGEPFFPLMRSKALPGQQGQNDDGQCRCGSKQPFLLLFGDPCHPAARPTKRRMPNHTPRRSEAEPR